MEEGKGTMSRPDELEGLLHNFWGLSADDEKKLASAIRTWIGEKIPKEKNKVWEYNTMSCPEILVEKGELKQREINGYNAALSDLKKSFGIEE